VPVVPDENHPKMLWEADVAVYAHLAEKREEDFNAVKKGF
jgi:hypothetical protein